MNSNLKALSTQTDQEPDLTRRAFLTGILATAVLPTEAVSQSTNAAVEAALRQALLGEIPEGSNLARHAATQPQPVVEEIQNALAHFRQADIDDQTPPRSSTLLESQIRQLGSTISIPQNPRILENFQVAHNSLNERLERNQYGLFIDGSTGTLYVVQKQAQGIPAVRQIRVSAAAAGFNNRTGSGGSPFGPMWISSVDLVRLHEARINENTRYINDGQLTRPGGATTISSVRLSISGYHEDNIVAQRGVAIHGSIEPGYASAGCFRADDVDAAILAQNYLIPTDQINEDLHNGTPLFVWSPENGATVPVTSNYVDNTAAVDEPRVITTVDHDPEPLAIQAPTVQPNITHSPDPDAASVVRLR